MMLQGGLFPLKDRIFSLPVASSRLNGSNSRAYGSSSMPLALLPAVMPCSLLIAYRSHSQRHSADEFSVINTAQVQALDTQRQLTASYEWQIRYTTPLHKNLDSSDESNLCGSS